MKMSNLQVKDLNVTYVSREREVEALAGVSFSLKKGEALGIMGESGSGKTTLALTLMGLLGKQDRLRGSIYYGEREFLSLKEQEKKVLRWKHVALLFQNSLEALNPVLKVREQVAEPLQKHLHMKGQDLEQRVHELFQMVGLERQWLDAYPHQLSGGMRQRVLLAMALACRPEVLIVDEPTTSLDPVSRREIVDLLERLRQEQGFTLVLITHDLACLERLTSRLLVLYGGRVVEAGQSEEILENPQHPYTRGLINSSPGFFAYRDLWGIPGEPPSTRAEGCAFWPRCSQSLESCRQSIPQLQQIMPGRQLACHRGGIINLLSAFGLRKDFSLKKRVIPAVQGVDLQVREGEVVGLVGETGSGKSTVAHMLGNLLKPTAGNVLFRGSPLDGSVTRIENGIQMVMQDPFASTSHRLTVEQAVREPLDINKIGTRDARNFRVREALENVQLSSGEDLLRRYCFALSGGQRQRVAIARALVMQPALLLADEFTSMLDPSTQANLLRLLKGLQNARGFAMLFITHDLDLARKVADRLLVMQAGKIVEEGSSRRIFHQPCCCYTKELMAAAFGHAH